MLLCFLGYLIYSLWIKHAQPFLQQQREEHDQLLKKLSLSNTHLQDLIAQQEAANTEKQKELLTIKETFLRWHQQRINLTTQLLVASEKQALDYKKRMAQKEIYIQKQRQQMVELESIIKQLQKNVQKAYQGQAGAERLKKVLEDLEQKGS